MSSTGSGGNQGGGNKGGGGGGGGGGGKGPGGKPSTTTNPSGPGRDNNPPKK
ncbi:MAG: hypothetical protein SFY69_05360 [Planctomycetota bacterium]|nr:hypothetical protein [Planctomycetota bacterium]